jgi:hypothetical protein
MSPPFLSVYGAGGRCIGFAMNAGPKGWLPVDAAGNNVADPLPTIEAAAEVLRELALHAVADGDL